MAISGAALTLTGGALLGLGLAADSAAGRYAGQTCETTSASRCYVYDQGATRPEEVATWAIPLGASVLSIGVLDLAIGAIWLASGRPSRSSERPSFTAYANQQGGGGAINIPF
jgi:hypothetical protein